jgi:hypothetical protein
MAWDRMEGQMKYEGYKVMDGCQVRVSKSGQIETCWQEGEGVVRGDTSNNV